jgi:rhamnose utilization protein RhaD (predicted bifunctional aldolase and dehydrogenase)/NAD(P)-dependent dehydrogenase (short-subunit alcohol dehydrogenase family)
MSGLVPPASSTEEALAQIVSLSNLVGQDEKLVQPGGGNTSIKVTTSGGSTGESETLLFVKGSGTDLKTIRESGFTRLALSRLEALRDVDQMDDADMMRFMATCMTHPEDPFPSVETPLHSILPHNVIVHTHDIATMSITNVNDAAAERIVRDLFQDEIVYVPYARPGFPLARLASEIVDRIPSNALGMTLAHHGLVVWGDDVESCRKRLEQVVDTVDRYLASKRAAPKPPRGRSRGANSPDQRKQLAELLMPAVRGALTDEDRVVLHLDDSDEIVAALADPGLSKLTERGVATPEHVLRAGKAPIWLALDYESGIDELTNQVRRQINEARARYEAYHQRHAHAGDQPIADWAKVVLVPGLGMITAFKDKKSARVANACYRATLTAIQNAEALGGFQFLPENQVFEFEHWPLERRKVEQTIEQERKAKLFPRGVVLVIGGAGGIGRAAAQRFLEEGANVIIADLDPLATDETVAALGREHPTKVVGATCDVTQEEQIKTSIRSAVLEFGGLDCLFYAAGAAPRFARVTDLTRSDLLEQIEVHYVGAVIAMREAAQVMIRQGTGGSIVLSVSKAAISAGKEALAYGSSKAALLQAMRVAAVELGEHRIRVNAINADQIDTPLFRRFVRERAQSRGITEEQQLDAYRNRNVMGVSLIPAASVGELAVLLASNRFQFTTGDILTIDGGLPDAFPR